MTDVHEKLLSSIDSANLVARTGKIRGICDFSEGSPSTFFFVDSSDPNWYAWISLTKEMHPTVLSAVHNTDHIATLYFNGDTTNLNRMIVYS